MARNVEPEGWIWYGGAKTKERAEQLAHADRERTGREQLVRRGRGGWRCLRRERVLDDHAVR